MYFPLNLLSCVQKALKNIEKNSLRSDETNILLKFQIYVQLSP